MTPPPADAKPIRLLVVLPSWLGDAVMATPALRLIRDARPGWLIGALTRPGIDQLLEGTNLFDQAHVAHPTGVLGPKRIGFKLRPHHYDAALLLTNSFSTALITRVAGIPRRLGYDRDGRGLLLTDRLRPPRTPDGDWAPVPAVNYYLHAARALLDLPTPSTLTDPFGQTLPPDARLELAVSPEDDARADAILAEAGLDPSGPLAILNPGGNNPAKRWPADRFAALADHIATRHDLPVLISGALSEQPLTAEIVAKAESSPIDLASLEPGLLALKAIIARASILITNDTGPRHLAAALGTPVVTLFGPTDHRWTTIPTRPDAPEIRLLADPDLPEDQLANDHPERCRIDRIPLDRVTEAADSLLRSGAAPTTLRTTEPPPSPSAR